MVFTGQCQRGFTLIELVIVIVIVGILAAVSVPVYNGYVLEAKRAEGRRLINDVFKAEQMYYARTGRYRNVSMAESVGGIPDIPVAAWKNRYFKEYKALAPPWGDDVPATVAIGAYSSELNWYIGFTFTNIVPGSGWTHGGAPEGEWSEGPWNP